MLFVKLQRLATCFPVLPDPLPAIVHGDTRSNLKIALPGSRLITGAVFLTDPAHRHK